MSLGERFGDWMDRHDKLGFVLTILGILFAIFIAVIFSTLILMVIDWLGEHNWAIKVLWLIGISLVGTVVYAVVLHYKHRNNTSDQMNGEQIFASIVLFIVLPLVLFGVASTFLESFAAKYHWSTITQIMAFLGLIFLLAAPFYISHLYKERKEKKEFDERMAAELAMAERGYASRKETYSSIDSEFPSVISAPQRKFGIPHFGIILGLLFIGFGFYQTYVKPSAIKVNAKRPWTLTDIKVKPGDIVSISATGQVTASTSSSDIANKWVGPEGWGYDPQNNWVRGDKPTNYLYILGHKSSLMCLVCKVSNGQPMMVGKEMKFEATTEGALYLGVNDAIKNWDEVLTENSPEWQDNGGEFEVTIKVK